MSTSARPRHSFSQCRGSTGRTSALATSATCQVTYCGAGGGGGSSFAVDPMAIVEPGLGEAPGGQGASGYVAGVGVGGASATPGCDGLAIVQFQP